MGARSNIARLGVQRVGSDASAYAVDDGDELGLGGLAEVGYGDEGPG